MTPDATTADHSEVEPFEWALTDVLIAVLEERGRAQRGYCSRAEALEQMEQLATAFEHHLTINPDRGTRRSVKLMEMASNAIERLRNEIEEWEAE